MTYATPLARSTDPSTSHAAAEAAADLRQRHQTLILACLREHGPAGKDGIARRCGISGVAVARRLTELERMGQAEPTGRTVPSDTGRQEREWCAVQER